MEDAILATYSRQNVSFKKGDGIWLYSNDGRKFLDCTSGIAVNILGHCNEKLVNVLIEQAKNLWHTSNLYRVENQEKLAKSLVDNTFADKVFFTNSGTEAIECAIKMARIYFSKLKQKRYEILSFDGCFHGRSMAAITTSNSNKMREGFGPLIPGFKVISFNDKSALYENINNKTAAVIVEPIQGEGGIRVFPEQTLKLIKDLCDKTGTLLIIDEVQCGLGRTGKLFAHEWYNIEPDIMAVAKGIGGGFPIGAVLMPKKVAKHMSPGTHGSTFGGNPLAMSVGNAVMDQIFKKGFLQNVKIKSKFFFKKLNEIQANYSNVIEEVRGKGLLIGLKLKVDQTKFINKLFENKLLTIKAADNVVRILPPLNVSNKEITIALKIIEKVCKSYN